MSIKILFLLSIILKFIYNQVYLDTDCYKEAGNSADTCKKLTTFLNETNRNIIIEENVLYLCCYVENQIINDNPYTGCLPIKEEVVFGDNKPFIIL